MNINSGLDRTPGWALGVNLRAAFGMLTAELHIWRWLAWLEVRP